MKYLRARAITCDLNNPESVKDAIALRNVSDGRKEILVLSYKRYAKWRNIEFKPPRYKRVEKLPFVPLESEIDQLIGALGKKSATFVTLLKDTGVRSGEAWNLKWMDLDPNTRARAICFSFQINKRPLTHSTTPFPIFSHFLYPPYSSTITSKILSGIGYWVWGIGFRISFLWRGLFR